MTVDARDAVELQLERWATGGTCIAYAAGATWFIRYGIPGERVRAKVTRRARGVVHADVIEVLVAAPLRTSAPCPHYGPGLCGGCDLQHVSMVGQRESKRDVLIDCLTRIGGIDVARVQSLTRGTVALATADDGLRWRTRMTAMRTEHGIGMHRLRSHELIEVDDCSITSRAVVAAALDRAPLGAQFRAAEGGDGTVDLDVDGPARVAESVHTPTGTVRWEVPVGAFWQVHRGFAQVLGESVLELASDVREETWWDLYSGVGLLASFLDGAGAERVEAVESDEAAVRAARRALHDHPRIRLHAADVSEWVQASSETPAGVVLDPPRRGCDPGVIEALGSRGISRLVYVSCDPASLGRDAGLLEKTGMRLEQALPIDAFPMTHHVETVALFTSTDQIS